MKRWFLLTCCLAPAAQIYVIKSRIKDLLVRKVQRLIKDEDRKPNARENCRGCRD
jgi:hypothetical protein